MGIRTVVLGAWVACTAVACGNETGIVLEVSMSPELATSLEQNSDDFSTLRIWVGQATDNPLQFTSSDDAFFSTPKTRADFEEPFRYLLSPTDGDLAAIGEMVFAAGVGDDPSDARVPFDLHGFAVADTPMDFHDGEIRIVPMALLPPSGVVPGISDGCIIWDMDTQTPSRITPGDDLDCDGAVGDMDCDDLDPHRNNLDSDADGVTSCANDCMDDPDPTLPWLDPASVHPGAIDDEISLGTCDHIDNDCDGICRDPSLDRDQSGGTICGPHVAVGGVCPVTIADCDENLPGNQPSTQPLGEACNGRDDACDGFLPPAIPCIIPDQPGTCFFGAVSCDEIQGEFVGEPDALDCKPLPTPFSQMPAPPIACDLAPTESCLESPDPVGCPTATGAARLDCVMPTSTDASCPPSRTSLAFPGVVPPPTCAWLIVGGVQQAEWEVGFVDEGSTSNTPMAMNTSCMPNLIAGVKSRVPTPRTVMLILISPNNPSFGARPLFVHLQPEPNGTCASNLACTVTAGG
jgi:hypothetical protein